VPGQETPRPSKRYPLSKKERRRVLEILSGLMELESVGSLEKAEFRDGFNIIVVDRLPCLVETNEIAFPNLICLLRRRPRLKLARVIVDRGATKAVARGATLMVPGIVAVEGEFGEGDIVVIVDEEAGVPVAIGYALMSSAEIMDKLSGERRGRAIKIIHRPGDKYWRAGEAL